jgi:hypothetical protein
MTLQRRKKAQVYGVYMLATGQEVKINHKPLVAQLKGMAGVCI